MLSATFLWLALALQQCVEVPKAPTALCPSFISFTDPPSNLTAPYYIQTTPAEPAPLILVPPKSAAPSLNDQIAEAVTRLLSRRDLSAGDILVLDKIVKIQDLGRMDQLSDSEKQMLINLLKSIEKSANGVD